MTRTVSDLATLLDVMVGYDSEDPGTALGFGKCPESYTHSLDRDGLKGARIGILSQSMGFECQPDTDDFRLVEEVFDRAVQELEDAGAAVVRIPEIPRLKELMATRASEGRSDESLAPIFPAQRTTALPVAGSHAAVSGLRQGLHG